jgi:hypothetical protein
LRLYLIGVYAAGPQAIAKRLDSNSSSSTPSPRVRGRSKQDPKQLMAPSERQRELLGEAVTHAGLGKQMLGVARVVLQLAAQLGQVHP